MWHMQAYLRLTPVDPGYDMWRTRVYPWLRAGGRGVLGVTREVPGRSERVTPGVVAHNQDGRSARMTCGVVDPCSRVPGEYSGVVACARACSGRTRGALA